MMTQGKCPVCLIRWAWDQPTPLSATYCPRCGFRPLRKTSANVKIKTIHTLPAPIRTPEVKTEARGEGSHEL